MLRKGQFFQQIGDLWQKIDPEWVVTILSLVALEQKKHQNYWPQITLEDEKIVIELPRGISHTVRIT